jgi:hypothetical protein
LPESFNKAEIKVFNMSVELVKTLVVMKDITNVEVYAESFTPGIYIYVLEIDGMTIDTKQMVVTK